MARKNARRGGRLQCYYTVERGIAESRDWKEKLEEAEQAVVAEGRWGRRNGADRDGDELVEQRDGER